MDTLIIHPSDRTTAFLNVLYNQRKNIEILDYNISNSAVRQMLQRYNSIMLLGHGTEYGLLSSYNPHNRFDRFFINPSHVNFLRNKELICIWCNANIFGEKYDLHGLFSGMVISEMSEAIELGVETTQEELDRENKLFAERLRFCLDNHSLHEIPEIFPTLDQSKSPLTLFNYSSIYYI